MAKCDVLVLGGGPAGLASAQYAARAGYDALVIDPMGPGGQLMFIDEIENYPGVKSISGYGLSELLESQANEFGVRIEYSEALSIKKDGKSFVVNTSDGEVEAKAVIVATGARHRHLEVPGEEEYAGRGVSYCATCDGPFFKGKKIVVVGGGDTALTDALYLSKLGESVTVVHRRTEFRAQKVLQERLLAKENIKTELGKNIVSIDGNGEKVTGVTLTDGTKLECDAVFIFVGTLPNSEIVKDVVELDGEFIKTDRGMRTSVDGIFACGDVRNTTFRQVVTACGDGAIAAHSADEYISNL